MTENNPKVTSAPQRLKFKDFSPHIDVTFWFELENRKLHEWKLDETPATLQLNYPSFLRAKHQLPNVMHVSGTSFPQQQSAESAAKDGAAGAGSPVSESKRYANSCVVLCDLLNFNTEQQIVKLDKKKALQAAGCKLVQAIKSRAWNQHSFVTASMWTFADLKGHEFQYAIAFPALDLESPVFLDARVPWSDRFSEEQRKDIHSFAVEESKKEYGSNPFVVSVLPTEGKIEFLPFSPEDVVAKEERKDDIPYVVFTDCSSLPEYPGWPLRNIIAAIRLTYPSTTRMRFVALRDGDNSVVFEASCAALAEEFNLDGVISEPDDLLVPNPPGKKVIKTVGWVDTKIRVVQMSSMMDPTRLAESSAKLNMSLMKWRMMPEIELASIQKCKALLLGAGTLGCNIARHLLMWGVTHITLVDRGNVSYSNPVRQTLFELSDVTATGQDRCKSIAAAKTLKRILPSATTRGINMTIRMPGHRVDDEKRAAAEADVKELEDLIKEHDVIFLLTDSRESRWLPTLLATAHNKPVINTALGFDTYLVMRHGLPAQGQERMGCYFCSDVVAPMDSLTARTLDQQCTVTRPGVSAISSAMSVEMLAGLYNHPQGFLCPAYTSSETDNADAAKASTCLGIIPHQIRGNVRDYTSGILHGQHYPKCTACSDVVVNMYRKEGFEFVLKCLNEPKYMEEVTGLKAEREAMEAAHANWDDEDF